MAIVYKAIAIAAALMCTTAYAAEHKDVNEDAWYYESVSYVSDNGLFDAKEDGSFAPESEMTRGMLVGTRWDGSISLKKSGFL